MSHDFVASFTLHRPKPSHKATRRKSSDVEQRKAMLLEEGHAILGGMSQA